MGYIIEDQGFTPEKYRELINDGVDDFYICNDILYVSRGTLRTWKLRHGLIGLSPYKRSLMDDEERIQINNEYRRKGLNPYEFCKELRLSPKSYRSWKQIMRSRGYEVI